MLPQGPHSGCMSTTAELNVRKQEFDNEVFDYDPLQLSLNHNSSHPATQKNPKRTLLSENRHVYSGLRPRPQVHGVFFYPPLSVVCSVHSRAFGKISSPTQHGDKRSDKYIRPLAIDEMPGTKTALA